MSLILNSESPLIASILMVKDESISIQSTLSSLLNAGIQDFVIYDTGSTDNTIDLAKSFCAANKLRSYIYQEHFVDFSTSRNRALELAEQCFANIPFFLMPDAEWLLHNGSELIEFCKQEKYSDTPLYLIKIKMNAMVFSVARLFRTAKHIRFRGVVHEVPEIIAQVVVSDPVYFEVKASKKGIEKTHRRWKQDVLLLSKEHERNPLDPRTTFYLAQTYECLNDLENAYRFYQKREQLVGWDEENFITLFRLGCLLKRMHANNPVSGWHLAMDYFLKAFSLRPHRIEPLIEIANYYWPSNIQACYLFIRYAYDIPYPKNDILFVDKEAYEYTRYEIMSRAAWYMGEFALGEEATLLALKAHPSTEHLLNNLKLYQTKLKSDSNDKEIIV